MKHNVPPRIAKLRAQIAVRVRYGQDAEELRAELRAEVLAENIRKTVAEWPPLDDSTRARLAALLAPAPGNTSAPAGAA